MENYRIIEALENKYFCLYHSKKYYKPVDAGWAFAAFAFFIIPRIIYLTVKHKQKARIKAHNQIIDRQIADVLKEVETLI